MAVKITPLPWHTPHSGAVAGDHDSDGYVVVAVTPTPRSPTGSAHRLQWEANAAFIVRAVNAHDDLVATLEMAKRLLSQVIGPDHAEWDEMKAICVALAKAEGK